MAAIAISNVFKVPLGKDWLVMCRTAAVTVNTNTEWLTKESLGLTRIHSAVATLTGITANAVGLVLNARGTGVAEGTNLGDLGIESATSAPIEVFVIGRGPRRS